MYGRYVSRCFDPPDVSTVFFPDISSYFYSGSSTYAMLFTQISPLISLQYFIMEA